MSSFQNAIENVLRDNVQPEVSQPKQAATPFERAFQDILKLEQQAMPGAVPGSAAGEADLMKIAAKQYEDQLITPVVGPTVATAGFYGAQPREMERGLRTGINQAAQAIATPGMRSQVFRSLMRPVEKLTSMFTGTDPAALGLAAQIIADKASQALEPEGSGLSVDDIRTELIAMRGASQGMQKGQQEGIAADIARGVGQNVPQFVGTAGALATGNVPVAASIAAMSLMPLTAYSSGFVADMEETDNQRALDALEGRELTPYSIAKSRTRAEAQAVVETAVELGGASVGGKVIGRLAGYGVKSRMGQAAMRPFLERGAPLATKALQSRAGQAGINGFMRLSNGTASFRNGFLGRGLGIVAASGAEEGSEELVSSALMAPFTAAPLSEDLAEGLYGAFIGGVAGGIGGTGSVLAVAGNRAMANRREAMRPETDRERVLRVRHSDALRAKTNWTADLDDAQSASVAAALDSLNGMTQEQRGMFLVDLAERRAQTQERAENLLQERQQLDVALMGARDPQSNATPDDVSAITDRIGQIDAELSAVAQDRLMASALHNAVAEKISEMPAALEQAAPEQVLKDVGTRAGVNLEAAQPSRSGRRVQKQIEALGRNVVWFRATDGQFNPAFHSMRSRGTVYLNADARPNRLMANALEEVFHDIQMFQPELAQVFMDKAGLAPVYEAGVGYSLRGRGETAAIQRLDRAAIAQAEDVIAQLEGGQTQISGAEARAGAARIEQEGAANAFAAAAGTTTGVILAPITRFAARRGFLGRDVIAAMAVFDAVQRSAAVENVAGPASTDATLSPLARTLLWASDMNISFARDIEEAAADQRKTTAQRNAERKKAAEEAAAAQIAARVTEPKATPEEISAAEARKAQVGKMEKMQVLSRLRASLVGKGKMREGERLAMSRRFLSAAASMANLSFRSLTPAEYLAGHKRNKATLTLTQYTLDQISSPQVIEDNGRKARVSFEPYGIPGLDVAYMVKKTEYLDEKGQLTGERYDEAVGLYSNEGDITDIIAPVMLHAISRYPDVEMRCDCYDVRRPGQTETNGKLPTAYRMYGFVADTNYGPTGFSPWNPEYLSPPPGMTIDDYIDTLVKYWTLEGWVAETDSNGNVTNYPGVWFAKLNITADERRKIRDYGLAGFAADPSRLARIAAGRDAGGAATSVELTEDGRPVANVGRNVEAAGAGDNQGNSGNPPTSADIFVGSSRRISLVNLTLALKRELESLTPQRKGRLLSASQWLYRAVETTPAAKEAEKKAASIAIDAAMRDVERAQAAYDRAGDVISKRRRELRKSLKVKKGEVAVVDAKRAAAQLEYVRLGKDSDLMQATVTVPHLQAELRAMMEVAAARDERKAKIDAERETIPSDKEIKAAKIEEGVEMRKAAFATRSRMNALRAEIDALTEQIDNWRASDPRVQAMLVARAELDEANQRLVDAKAQTFGDLLADRGLLSYRLANDRNYTVGELQGLLDSFSQSIVGWLDEYTERKPMPADIQRIIVESLAEDLKYAATKAGEESALEWYGRIIDTMWDEAAKKYPEMADVKSDDRIVFAMMLAITSQGEKVRQNALLSRALYEEWKANGRGRIRIPKAFDARHIGAMSMNFDKLNALYDHFGSWAAVEKMMLEKTTVREHNKFLKATKMVVNGESVTMSDVIGNIKDSADDVTYMSSVLGPKIGSFYNNLHKRFDTLTADVWFTRTFFRPLGGLRRPDATAVRSAVRDISMEIAKARAVLANAESSEADKAAAQRALDMVPEAVMADPAMLEKVARDFNSSFPKDPNNRIVVGTSLKMRPKTAVESALVRYAKALDASAAAPDSNYIRSLMRQLVNEAIASVKKQTGLEYQLADAQAGLWYVEKELYAAFGAADDPAGQDYRKAMSDAMSADLNSDAVRRDIAEAVAANNAAAEQADAASESVIADDGSNLIDREEAMAEELSATKAAIENQRAWAESQPGDVQSFAREPSPKVMEMVESGGWKWIGVDGRAQNAPQVLYHNTDDPKFNPFRNRIYKNGICFTNLSGIIRSFGKYQSSYYVMARNPLYINCRKEMWNSIPVDAIPEDLYEGLNYDADEDNWGYSTDTVQRVARDLGYDVVVFNEVLDDGGLHSEFVVMGRENLVSLFTGNTLLDDDKHQWKLTGGVQPINDMTFVRTLGGSTGARLFRDDLGGNWVVKSGASQEHQENEANALRGYKFLNGHVPVFSEEFNLDNNKWFTVTKFLEGAVSIGDYRRDNEENYETSRVAMMLQRDYVDHVLMRNWDVVGLEADNILVDPVSEQLYYIDVGGSLAYRAMGAPKPQIAPSTFASELVSLQERNANWFSKPDPYEVVTRVLDVHRQIEALGGLSERHARISADVDTSVKLAMSFLAGTSFPPLPMINANTEKFIKFATRQVERLFAGESYEQIRFTSLKIADVRIAIHDFVDTIENGEDVSTATRPSAMMPSEPSFFLIDQIEYDAMVADLRNMEDGLATEDIDKAETAFGSLVATGSTWQQNGDLVTAAEYGVIQTIIGKFVLIIGAKKRSRLAQQAAEQQVEPLIMPVLPEGTESMARSGDNESEVKALQARIDALQREIRDVQNVTAAQRANALREVRVLERQLSTATLLAEQKQGQALRMKARLERAMQINTADRATAEETVSRLEGRIDEAKARINKLRQDIRDQRQAAREAVDVLAETEEKVDRVANWAYAIGRNEGLVAGQVAGMQAERRANRPFRERLPLVEARLAQASADLKLARQRIKSDAKAAQRAIDFAHQMGMNHGVIQGMMAARIPLLKKMQKREEIVQRQIAALRTMLTKSRDILATQRAARRIARDAALMLPTRLRGDLATKIAAADTVFKANRVAINAIKIAVDEEVRQQLKVIAALEKRMGRRGMRWEVRQDIEKLLQRAKDSLKEANRRRIKARVGDTVDRFGRKSGSAVVNAVRIYQQVAASAQDVEAALLMYENDHNSYLAAQAARVARYDDLKTRLLGVLAGRPTLAARRRADQPPVQSLAKAISLANSDIYTLMVETEGTTLGVINEMLVAAQDGKGEAALEHARIIRSMNVAMLAAGYNGIEDYALRNGLGSSSSAETISVTLGGATRVLPVGVVMSIAAMDDDTLAQFVPPTDPNKAKQGMQFAGAETTLTVYPTDAEIRALRAALTPGQRALIDEMKNVLETQIRDRAMEAVFLVEGDQPPVVANYWPVVRNMDEFQGENKSVLNNHSTLVRNALTSVGFANAREGGRQPIIYRDAFQTWERHVTVALDMIHMAQPYRDASTVLTDPRIVEKLDRQHGRGTAQAILAIFSNGVGATARSSTNFVDRLTNNVTSAVLTMSPRTAAKVVVGGQIRLASEIPGVYLTIGAARSHALLRSPISAWQQRVEEVHAYSGYFSRRHQMQMRSIVSGTLSGSDRVKVTTAARGFARAVAASGQAMAGKQITDALNYMGEAVDAGNMTLTAMVDMLRLMDEQIMLTAVEARLAEVRDEGLSGDAAFREAVKRAERDFRLTQNASDEFDETVFVATNRLKGAGMSWRMLFPFSSDPLKARNQIRRAWLTGERRIGTAVAIGGNTASSTIIGAASTMTVLYLAKTVAALLGGADEPDDEEDREFNKAVKDIPTTVASELIGSTFGYVGLAFSTALSAYVYGRAAGQALVARPVEQFGREATDDGAWYANALPAILALAQLRGVPLYQLWKFVEKQVPEGKPAPAEQVEKQKKALRDRYTPEAIRKRILDDARRKAAGQVRLP